MISPPQMDSNNRPALRHVVYKFIYFNLRGRGETIRYLFVDNGIEYEEVLVDFSVWPKDWKPQMQFGQLPCLRDDDFQLVQFNAILRHLGRKHGLYGDGNEEAAKIDMISDGVEDIRKKYSQMIYGNYKDGKQPYIDELPKHLGYFEKQLSQNDAGKSGFSVGNKRSFLDYNMFDILDIHLVLSPSCLDNFPVLGAFHKLMLNSPKISAHRETDAFKQRTINYGGVQ